MLKKNIYTFFKRLSKKIPNPETELNYTNNFTLLVAVVLSAQMTDIGVNKATKKLFRLANTPERIIKLGETKIKNLIKTINFCNTKAKNIFKLSLILIKNFNSSVPKTREELETLPGVGRKTANVILSVAFKKPTIAVDTHIFRVSNRTKIANGKKPIEVELGLEKNVPKKYLNNAHHLLILHGRYICKARNPECYRCVVNDLCMFKNKNFNLKKNATI
jgi:endonuclease-3